MKNFATLRKDSPFFPIFADGRVPILNLLGPSQVKLEGNDETDAYLVDWQQCTIAQRAAIGEVLIQQCGGTFREFMKHMANGGQLPLRVSQTISANLGADLRLFV